MENPIYNKRELKTLLDRLSNTPFNVSLINYVTNEEIRHFDAIQGSGLFLLKLELGGQVGTFKIGVNLAQ